MISRVRWMLMAMLFSAVLAGLTAWFVTDWTLHRHSEGHAHDVVNLDLHTWMHDHLDITPEQHEKLAPLEEEFEQRRKHLTSEIRAAGQEVAAAISGPQEDAKGLQAALSKLNQAQGALQRATLDHFFAMKRYLRPAQAKKLVEWTHDSLTRSH